MRRLRVESLLFVFKSGVKDRFPSGKRFFIDTFFQFCQNTFEPIDSDFVHRAQPHPELTFWKTLPMHPNQIMLRDVAQESSFVLPKGHRLGHEVNQNLSIHF